MEMSRLSPVWVLPADDKARHCRRLQEPEALSNLRQGKPESGPKQENVS